LVCTFTSRRHRPPSALKFNEDRAQPGHSGEERLAAVQHYLDVAKVMRLDVLGDSHRRLGDNIGRDEHAAVHARVLPPR
jgi:hypothetical protein